MLFIERFSITISDRFVYLTDKDRSVQRNNFELILKY